MSQEMNVLCCYSCQMFQVHIVKKEKKWQCKVCNEKQSIRRVYFQGLGKDCRLYVQQLNSQKQENFESVQTEDSDINDENYVSCDNTESSSNQQSFDKQSSDFEMILDDSMQASDEEYTYKEEVTDSVDEKLIENSNYSEICNNEIYNSTNSERKESEHESSESTCNISNKGRFMLASMIRNNGIFESYEDFDSDIEI